MEPFHKAVCLRVVGGGVDALDGEGFAQFRPERGGKLSATIRGEVGGDAKPGNPTPDQGVGTRCRGDVLERNRLRPS